MDAVILGSRLMHDRTLDHTGTQTADTVVLTSQIGPYAAGMTVQAVLEAMIERLTVLDSSTRRFGTFSVNSYIPPHFTLNSIVLLSVSSTFTANAVISPPQKSFTIDARIFIPSELSFAIDAYIV